MLEQEINKVYAKGREESSESPSAIGFVREACRKQVESRYAGSEKRSSAPRKGSREYRLFGLFGAELTGLASLHLLYHGI